MKYKESEIQSQKPNTNVKGVSDNAPNIPKTPKLLKKLQINKKLLNPPEKSKQKALILIIILCVVVGGFFYWWKFYETPVEKWDEAEYSKPEDYVEKQTDKGILIENKKAGISFIVPEGWRVEKERYTDCIALFSHNAIEKSFVMESGCKIRIEARNIKAGLDSIEQTLREGHKSRGYIDEYETAYIDNYSGLKNTSGIKSLDQHYIGIYIPAGIFSRKVYSIGVSSLVQDKEICIQEFDQFLKTVSIK